ncbi:DUF6090 family protein [Kordia algicida OT-1]|uniref:Uncharacterized protein n=1 Tax=Kordia algicida OT-1 TaxID=391587 RepID=A9E0M4_9FLAO|nr:DUF6090 family protein [Kordia algicida]EDP95897.1 hypothetical protein KAOT1_05817 [Kordia algicida OT-1]
MGKTTIKKYLKYAFGEIILVVIGILIAVGINNWNQRTQLNSSNVELRKNVINQLEKDILHIETYEKELDTLQNNYLNILDKAHDKSMLKRGSVVGTLLFSLNTMDTDTHVINMIDNAKLNESKASEKLLNLNAAYKIYLEEIKDVEDLIFETITDNLKEIERTQDWYTDFITDFVCKNECISYLKNDKRHKARMASLRFLYVNSYGNIIRALKKDLISYKNDLELIVE